MFIPPLRIALSGGGIKGLAHVGALEVLAERGFIKQVREYIGISAGAFCAFCICIGCTLSELRLVVTTLDFGLIRHLEPETLFQFPESFGLDDGVNLDRLISAILKTKGYSPELTFGELAAIAKRKRLPALRIFATDLNTCLNHEFSAAATPTTAVRLALRATMSIPFYFTPVKDISGHTFVDGGVISNLPFSIFSFEERVTFLVQLFFSIHYSHLAELSRDWGSNIVFLPCGSFVATNFEATTDQKIALMESGREGMAAFLAAAKGKAPPRRFSVS
jgi:NTE family protein